MARIKNIEAFCTNCGVVRKMEVTGELAGEENQNKRWAKCKKCKQTMVIDLASDVKEMKPSLVGIEPDATDYSPQKTFSVGDAIYHKEWDDYGKIVAKEVMANGRSSIAVEFQKSGLKKLIESLNQ